MRFKLSPDTEIMLPLAVLGTIAFLPLWYFNPGADLVGSVFSLVVVWGWILHNAWKNRYQ